jgi:PAS domain S-box-containing protein
MIVEDEALVARDIKNSLISFGYEVCAMASFGEDAIRMAEENKPDLVMMDIMLKGKMDGIQAADEIRRRFHIPVVYLTAYTDEDTIRRAKVSEAFGYLLKPFEERELRTTIEMALYKHQMERQLKESHEWLHTILQCIGDAVIATNSELSIRFINPKAERIIGWTANDCINKKITDVLVLLHGKDIMELGKITTDIMQTGNFSRYDRDIHLLTRAGTHIPVEANFSAIKGIDEKIFGVAIVIRDITDLMNSVVRQQELQERLARAHRMESLGVLAGGVAQDLNNILGPATQYPDILMQQLPADSKMRQDLEIMKNSIRKAIDIVNDLLALGRIGSYQPSRFNFKTFYSQFIKSAPFMALRNNMLMTDFIEELPDAIPDISGSEKHLQEMFINLMLHAFEAAGENGKIKLAVTVEEHTSPSGGFETIEKGKYLVISTMYSSKPMTEEEISRLFEPFFVKQHFKYSQGSGLGLAVVYGVIKEHKGFVDVIAGKENGNEIKIYLPISDADYVPSSTHTGTTTVSPQFDNLHGNEVVLIVDDSEEERRTVARYLRSLGYETLLAPNGKVALEILASSKKGETPPIDIILIDMIMGDSLDGLETYKKILEISPNQKAIITSGFAITERIKEAMRLGVGAYLQKPLEETELARTIRQVLDEKTTPRG